MTRQRKAPVRRSKKPDGFPAFDLRPGDRVLYGTYGITWPGEWIHAVVLWVGDEQCLIEHSDLSGTTIYRDVVDLTAIRAVGDFAALCDFRSKTREAMAEKRAACDTAQQAAEDARRAMWSALDDIGAASVDLRAKAPAA